MSYRKFVNQVAQSTKVAGGGGGDFVDVNEGVNVFRLFKDPAEREGYNFFQHWVDRRTSVVCRPKTFKDASDCEVCEQVELLKEAGSKDDARKIDVRAVTWLCVVPGDTEKIGVVSVTGATMQKILGAAAMVGGWSGDADWDNEEFIECIGEGLPKCYGERARDLILTKNSQATYRDMYKVRFSTGRSKVVNPTNEPPDLLDMFRTIKKLDGGDDDAPKKSKRKVPAKKKPVAKKRKVVKKKPPKKKGKK